MENSNHPEIEEIHRYIAKELPEEEEIALGEHLAYCAECCAISRNAFKNKLFWDNWTARQHGEVYWKKRIGESIASLQAQALGADLKIRLGNWLDSWQKTAGGLLGLILDETQKACRVITDFSQLLLTPGHSLHFAYDTVVRGAEEERNQIRVISKEKPEVQVITDTLNKKVIVQIEGERSALPLVILVPEKGEPLLAEPQKVAGTNFNAACFENLPAGEYTLIFEPK